jgi:ligand-binding sensor domain-containing protein
MDVQPAINNCMGLWRLALWLLCCWAGQAGLYGQAAHFRHYTVEDGLPSQRVYRATVDSKGYLWVCTDRGLARFDGYGFEVFTVRDGLPYNDVFNVQEDRQGRLWLHSFAGQLAYFDLEKERFHTLANPLFGFGDDVINGVLQGRGDTVEIVTSMGSLLTDGHKLLQHSWGDAVPWTSPITVRTARGCCRGGFVEGGLQLPCRTVPSPGEVPDRVFLWRDTCTLCWYKGDSIWAQGMQDQVVSLRDLGGRAGDVIRLVYPVTDTSLFVRTGEEAFFLDSQLRRIANQAIPAGRINSVSDDRAGNRWFCTEDNGVYMMTQSRRSHLVLLQDEDVRAVVVDGEQVWMGTARGSLHRHTVGSLGSEALRFVGGMPDYSRGLLAQAEGLWAMFDQRMVFVPRHLMGRAEVAVQPMQVLTQFDMLSQTSESRLFPPEAGQRDMAYSFPHWKAMAPLRAGGCAFPDSGRFVGDTLRLRTIFRKTGLPRRVYAIEEDGAGRIWYGSPSGLAMQDDRGQDQLASLRAANPLLQKSVLDITRGADGWIWVATDGFGMYGFDPQKLFRGLGPGDAAWLLEEEIIKSLYAAPDGTVWAATNQGAFSVQHAGRGLAERRFSTANGLPTNAVNALCIVRDSAYVATQKGLAILPLKSPAPPGFSPPLILKMSVNGAPYNASDPSRVPFGMTDVAFTFVCLSYQSDAHIRYRYRLSEQGDAPWRATHDPRVNFPMLQPGTYTFEVEATDIGGNLSARQRRTFVIPSWWQQNWIYGIGAVLAVALLLATVALYGRYIRRRERMRNAFTDLRLRALQAQMNPHFVSNTLVAVQSLITEGRGAAAKEYLALFADLSRRYLDASHLKYVPLEAELEMLRSYLDLEKLRFGDKFDYEISASPADLDGLSTFPARLLQPLAENAIHHGLVYLRRQGRLRVRVHRSAHMTLVSVADDGIGRVAAARLRAKRRVQQTSRGSALIEGIVRAVNTEGKVHIELVTTDLYDAAGQATGTLVEVRAMHPGTAPRSEPITHGATDV